ncbi:hypothetical protein [Nocardioides aestuarii]|uniref:O-antigen ligase domain-containing protein n=1 Tax=Nocardioides aestuarii TaxID=252231 RepID=A0ABW4TL46_9ACTN
MSVAGLQVGVNDLALVLYSFGAINHLRQVAEARAGHTLALALVLALYGVSLIRGLPIFGASAVSEARSTLLFLAVIVWVLAQSRREDFRTVVDEFITWTGIGLVGLAILNVALHGVGAADEFVLRGGELVSNRPLIATQAAFLGLAAIYLAVRRKRLPLAALFLIVVLVAQHRSVWAATVAGLLVAVLVSTNPVTRARIIVSGVYGSALFVLAALAGLLGDVLTDLAHSFQSRGTLEDRQGGWDALLIDFHAAPLFERLIGLPFGSGYERYNESGELVTYSPHSLYVTAYLRIGMVGACAGTALLLGSLLRHLHTRHAERAALLVMLLTYGYAYYPTWPLAVLMAVALMFDPVPDPVTRLNERASTRQ